MKLRTLIATAAGVLLASSAAFAEVSVTIGNGRVTVIAKDATLRQIMTEWARVGQTKVVNIERIPGGPVTLELRDMPEDRALDVLMRALSGYVAAPRPVQASNLSRFDRIVVMPTVAAARQPTTTSAPPPAPTFPTAPAFQQQAAQPEEDEPPAQPGAPRGPVFTAFPQPQIVNPNAAQGNGQQPTFVPPPGLNNPGSAGAAVAQPATPSATPTAPVGVAVPGMIVPTPQQQQQQNPATIRRPGGGL